MCEINPKFMLRASSVHLVMSTRGSVGMHSYVEKVFKENLLKSAGIENPSVGFSGSRYTEKGHIKEPEAIKLSGRIRMMSFVKNERRECNGLVSGECDIYDSANRRIIDTKCTFSIDSHPFFQADAKKKALSAGYDWQMQAYMWLYDCDVAEVDFWWLPTPLELIKPYEDRRVLHDVVMQMPIEKRVTTVVFSRDNTMIRQMEDRAMECQEIYSSMIAEYEEKSPFRIQSKKDSSGIDKLSPNQKRKVVLL